MVNCIIDKEIYPLVKALNSDVTVTAGSCSGHGEELAYVSFYVKTTFMRRLTQILDQVHEGIKRSLCMDLNVLWCSEIAGVPYECWEWPDWLLVNLTISSCREFPPTDRQLAKLAKLFAKYLPGSGRPLRGPGKDGKGEDLVDLEEFMCETLVATPLFLEDLKEDIKEHVKVEKLGRKLKASRT